MECGYYRALRALGAAGSVGLSPPALMLIGRRQTFRRAKDTRKCTRDSKDFTNGWTRYITPHRATSTERTRRCWADLLEFGRSCVRMPCCEIAFSELVSPMPIRVESHLRHFGDLRILEEAHRAPRYPRMPPACTAGTKYRHTLQWHRGARRNRKMHTGYHCNCRKTPRRHDSY